MTREPALIRGGASMDRQEGLKLNASIDVKQLNHLRRAFKEYLRETDPEMADGLVSQLSSDAFFALNNDIGVDFWASLMCETSFLKAQDRVRGFLNEKHIDDPDQRAKEYLSSMRKFKDFLDEKHPNLASEWCGKAIGEVNLRSDFRTWMKRRKKSNGDNYRPNTINQYISALKNATSKLGLGEAVHANLFFYTSLAEFDVARRTILAAPNFAEIDAAAGNKAYSSGMDLYARFLSELDELDDEIVSKRRYWLYSPGEQARLWEMFYTGGMMGIGWEDIGDLTQFANKAEIKAALRQKYDETKSYKNDGLALWQFAFEMTVGDVVFAKRGMNAIIGRGIVESEYEYDESRDTCKHIHRVNWTQKGEWAHPGQAAMKTLTDITPYTGYVEQLEALVLGETDLNNEDELEIQYPNYTETDFLGQVYISAERYTVLKELLKRKKNVILQGAPGVGKTYTAQRLAFSFMGLKDTERVKVIQFHQSYSYEDFIMGYRPNATGGFTLTDGPFYKFCKAAESDDERPYFFIIDEINRGNLSKIFGELLMLIECDKRGEKNALRLLYKDEQFSVPDNVYIIGMMNTADRSLAMIDYALRRRFAFFELEPAFQSEGFMARKAAIQNPKYDALIAVVELLNRAIVEDASLGAGFRIGHSYFCTKDIVDDAFISSVIEYELIPLLNEYWFDEPLKIEGWVARLRGVLNG